jgi:hypothetical protein
MEGWRQLNRKIEPLSRNDAVKGSEFDRMNRIDRMEKQIGIKNGASPSGNLS